MSFRPGPLDIEIAEMEHHGIEPRVLQIAASIDAAISMKTPSPHYAEIRYRADLHLTRAVEMRIFSRALGDHRTGRRYAHALATHLLALGGPAR